ncbi:MAG TPA: tetratricopeptide repeat protein [Vicinamibacteria bacterium]|nr:tetratricopeptide repeat protein [Vicinamibacteria bacterium]
MSSLDATTPRTSAGSITERCSRKPPYRYEASETLFLRALEMRPDDPELLAELGDLYLMWARPGEARELLEKSLGLDPLQPVAALGKARLDMLDEKWDEILAILLPLFERFPRLCRAHQFLAAAYGALGDEEKQELHREAGEYGSAVESPLMRDLHELAVPAILNGDASKGCARCHDQESHHRTRRRPTLFGPVRCAACNARRDGRGSRTTRRVPW